MLYHSLYYFPDEVYIGCYKRSAILNNLKEVGKQGDNALVVIARKIGTMEKDQLKQVTNNDTSVKIAGIDSLNRQFYQSNMGIVVVVKYALS